MADSTYAASPQPALNGAIATNDQAVALANGTYSRLPTPAAPASPPITPTTPVPATPAYNATNDRNNQIASRESEFSALDQEYNSRIASMTADEQKLGAKDLARANTISALTGMTGGVDATSRAGGVERNTDKIIQQKTDMLNAEKANALRGIYSQIDQNVQRQQDIANATIAADRTKLVDQMNQSAQSNVMKFASQGISWDAAYKDPEFQAEVGRTGKTPFEVQTLYNNSLPKNLQPTQLFSGFKGNNFVQIFQNSDGTVTNHTYDAKTLGIPTTIADLGTVTLGNKVYWYDKSAPLDSNGKPKLTEVGPKAATSSTDTSTGASKTDISGALTWMRAQPDFTKSMETTFGSDAVIQAKVIEAWKASTKKSSSTDTGNPFAP